MFSIKLSTPHFFFTINIRWSSVNINYLCYSSWLVLNTVACRCSKISHLKCPRFLDSPAQNHIFQTNFKIASFAQVTCSTRFSATQQYMQPILGLCPKRVTAFQEVSMSSATCHPTFSMICDSTIWLAQLHLQAPEGPACQVLLIPCEIFIKLQL